MIKRRKLMAKILVLAMCTSLVPYTIAFADGINNQVINQSIITEETKFSFDINTGTIKKYLGGDGAIGIPSKIGGVTVTSIGEEAFKHCGGITSIIIPDSVKSIGNSAFSECSGLTSITIPDSVTNIGDSAFSECVRLTNITIPDSVTSIGKNAFFFCYNLTNIDIPNSLTSIQDYTFKSCTGLKSIVIPKGVKTIGEDAFQDCESATSLIIPDSVTSIGHGAFYGCYRLTSLTIPNSVTSIGDFAFIGCKGLTSLTIPNSVTSIGGDAFSGCVALKSVIIPKSVTSIKNNAFNDENQAIFYVDSQKTKDLLKSIGIRESKIILSEPPATTLILSSNNLNCVAGQHTTIRASIISSTETTTSEAAVTWSSSDSNVATVDADGNIIAVGAGNAIITCSTAYGSGASATCNVTVTNSPLVNVNLISLSTNISKWTVGQTGTFTANVFPSNSTDKTVTWTSSNTNIASVSSGGLVTPKSVGDVTITATANDGSRVYGSKTITISGQNGTGGTTSTEVKVAGITITGSDSINTKGGTLTLIANIIPSTTTNKTVTWTSSNASIATVSNGGVVTAKANGNVNIVATANDGSGIKENKTITISGQDSTDAIPTDIKVTWININWKGDTLTLIPSIYPSTATNKTVTWTSSSPSIATVSSQGVVTCVSKGRAIITATATDGSNVSGIKVVDVTGQTTTPNNSSSSNLKSVSISGTEEVGNKLKAKVKYDGTKPDLKYQWQRASKKDGEYTDISSADEEEYKLKSSDRKKYIKVIITETINGVPYRVQDITSKIDRDTSDDEDNDSASSSGSSTINNGNSSNITVFRPSNKENNSSNTNSYSPGNVAITNPAGHPINGWIKLNNEWYCLDDNGVAKVGWFYSNGKWYYLNSDSDLNRGVMRKGWIKDNGKWYYLDKSSGAMVTNTAIDGYVLGEYGAMI